MQLRVELFHMKKKKRKEQTKKRCRANQELTGASAGLGQTKELSGIAVHQPFASQQAMLPCFHPFLNSLSSPPHLPLPSIPSADTNVHPKHTNSTLGSRYKIIFDQGRFMSSFP
ncbi:hypothetical protein H0G86_002148 [Trichoderma simmonsii]|uniref:Uncharacterized protein n=1 Tax=Trichoderma simmonsii TaxID=1491479 RepID=A0A8G0L615_9HYPO|nr:hypothetical protein H0G86_002148 [Trichoderma simmonsii]